MTKLDADLAAKLCAEFLGYADRFGITAEVVNGAIPESNLRALAEQLMAALEELTRLRSDEATMKLSQMLGLGDPVRPDIHASVCRQRDAALREVERMRQALCEARYPLAIAASYQDDPSITLGLRIHARQSAAAVTAIDAALSTQDKDLP